MTAQIKGIDEAEKYAAKVDVPMHLIDEPLIRKMLRNAFASGMNAGMRIAVQLIKEHQK